MERKVRLCFLTTLRVGSQTQRGRNHEELSLCHKEVLEAGRLRVPELTEK